MSGKNQPGERDLHSMMELVDSGRFIVRPPLVPDLAVRPTVPVRAAPA